MGKMRSINPDTIELVKELRKVAKEKKQGIWLDLAQRLDRSRKFHATVNLEKLNKMALANPGKVLVVPGKVLAKGLFSQKARIAAVSYSEKARTSINKTGKALNLSEVLSGTEKPADFIIVK